jgi:hypothetical protein
MSSLRQEPFSGSPGAFGCVAGPTGQYDVAGIVPPWPPSRDDVVMGLSGAEAVDALAFDGGISSGRVPHLGCADAGSVGNRKRSALHSQTQLASGGLQQGASHLTLLRRADLCSRFCGNGVPPHRKRCSCPLLGRQYRSGQSGMARLHLGKMIRGQWFACAGCTHPRTSFRSVVFALGKWHREPPSTRWGREPVVEAPTPRTPRPFYIEHAPTIAYDGSMPRLCPGASLAAEVA